MNGLMYIWTIWIIALFWGMFDYFSKGVRVDNDEWNELPEVVKGDSWGIIMIAMYSISLFLFSIAASDFKYMYGLILFANQDFSYWLFRFIVTGNSLIGERLPLNIREDVYLTWIVLSNLLIFTILK